MNKNTRGAATNPASSVTPEYLDAFHQMLPELFDEKPLPNNWEDGVVLIPSGGALSSDIEEDGVERILFPELLVEPQSPANLEFNSEPEFPDLSDWNPLEWPAKARFPGAPENAPPKGQFPSTDVLAFYLPFHYFYPDAWGVYIFVEGVQRLVQKLRRDISGLSMMDAFVASRAFLYGHEVFHHCVEAFATRLEVTHRQAFYKVGFDALYLQDQTESDCAEESLANAYALRRVKGIRGPAQKVMGEALADFVRRQPARYRRGADIAGTRKFHECRNSFAERNQAACLPALKGLSSGVWETFSHAFDGFMRRGSQFIYVLPKSSPLAARVGIQGLEKRRPLTKLDSGIGQREKEEIGSMSEVKFGVALELLLTAPDPVVRGAVLEAARRNGIDLELLKREYRKERAEQAKQAKQPTRWPMQP